MRINNTGDRVVIDVAVALRDEFGARDSFLFRFVREHWPADHVADGENARHTRRELDIDVDAAFLIQFYAGVLEAESLGIGDAASGEEHTVARDGIRALALDHALVAFSSRREHFRREAKLETLAGEKLLGLGRD